MNYSRILLPLAVIVAALTCTNCTNIKKVSDASFQLKLQTPIDKWDEAIPLGNGLTGGLWWGEGNEIRLSLDRGDIWDNRAHPGFTAPGFTYDVVREMANSGKTDLLNKQVVANRRLREGKY
jgi:alpha-L-fucosidase 2